MVNSFGSYKRVFMLGIDGMGAFKKNANTPNMDKLFENGATTYTAVSSNPTISAQCWTSMLTGAIPEVHKLTNSNMHPIPELPTVFRLIKNVYPNAETAAFTHWSPIALEIISPDGGIDAYDVGHEDGLCDRLLEYLDNHDPKMLFIQFDGVDGAGHDAGYGFQHHLDAISHADELLGKLVSKYEERGYFEDTLFIVSADHGGTVSGSHGGWSEGERLVFLGVAGKNVEKGQIGEACLRDYPAIVLHALGVEAPEFDPKGYAAQMPLGIFEDVGVVERKPVYPDMKKFDASKKEQPMKGDFNYIGNYIDENRIKFWQTFEDGIDDVTGNCKVSSVRGFVKTYNNGFVGKSGEFGQSVLKVENAQHSDVFSFAFWFYTTEDTRWMDLFSNKDGVHDSFSIAPYGVHVGIYIKEPDGNQTDRTLVSAKHYENSVTNMWTHYIFEVDTVKNEINCYANFEKIETVKAGRDLKSHFNMDTLYLALDRHGDQLFYKIFDDIMIIDGHAEPEALEKYYKA